MNIRIDNDYKLTSDDRNVILTKVQIGQSGKSKGKEVKTNVGFYATIEHALKDYLRIKINSSEATSINQLTQEIKETRKVIEDTMRVWEELEI